MNEWSERVVVDTCRFLEQMSGRPNTCRDEFLIEWVRFIKSESLHEASVTINLERCDDEERLWWFVASTGTTPEADEKFSYSDGLTGWILRNRRTLYFASSPAELPDRANFVKSFGDRHCAVAAVCYIESSPYAVICAVGSHADAIQERSAKNLARAARLLEAWLWTRTSSAGPLERANITVPRDNEQLFPGWLRAQLPRQYVWANWWLWRQRDGKLHPHPLPTDSEELVHGLKAMEVGEGFVGRVAETRKAIYEPSLVKGVGIKSGIVSPYPRLATDARIKSIYATPVQFDEEFFGVLAILGEVPMQFGEADFERIEIVVTEFATRLHGKLVRRRNRTRRETAASLLEILVSPPLPADYWSRLREVLGNRSQDLWRDANVFVRNSDNETVYDVHGLNRAFDLEQIDPLTDPFLRDVMRRDGVCAVSEFADSRLRASLEESGLERIWIGRYPPKAGEYPEFIAMVSLSPYSTGDQAQRSRVHICEQIFESVYATTRAVLGAAELLSQKRARDQMVTLETHEFRQPISSIRQEAQFLRQSKNIGNADRDRIEAIFKHIDSLDVKAENIMYSSHEFITRPGLRNEAKREVFDIHTLIAQALVEVRRRTPGQSIVFLPQKSPGYFVRGRSRWMLLAIRNILDNAVKFGLGRPIRVRLREMSDEMHRRATIEVKDLGIGIPRDELMNIFTAGHRVPYTRRHELSGSQTALSVTREIVRDHFGEIWAESDVKKGARFFVKLPIRERSFEHENSMG